MFAAFNKIYPNVRIEYQPAGNNVPTVLATAIAGGRPPDMADIAQPGLIKQFADQHQLKPLTYATSRSPRTTHPHGRNSARSTASSTPLSSRQPTSRPSGTTPPPSEPAGIAVPKTWAQLVAGEKTLKASGTRAYSIGGADGWTLTDIFENIYLRTFGPAKYTALSAHAIKWTDPSVITALKTMAQVMGKRGNLAGGTLRCSAVRLHDSVTNAFSTPREGCAGV